MMKKHLGVAKSTQVVDIGQMCFKNLTTFVTLSGSPSRIGDVVRSFANSATLAEQISNIKQLATVAQNQSEGTLVLGLLTTLFLNPKLQKSSLQKVVGNCLEATSDMIAKKFSSPELVADVTIYRHVESVTNTKEYLYCVKCLVESPAGSTRYNVVTTHISNLLQSTCTHLMTCLRSISDDRKDEDSGLHSDNVSMTHAACQVFFRLLSVCDLQQTPQLSTHLQMMRNQLHHALLQGCGNMDLLISVGLCIAQLTLKQSAVVDEVDRDDHLLAQVQSLLLEGGDPAVERSAHDFAQCCLLNGIVSSHQQHSLPLHRLILRTVCSLLDQKMYTATLLVFIKMLVAWTAALRHDETYQGFVEKEVYDHLFNHLFLVWEHSAETIRRSSRDVFANLLIAVQSNESLRFSTLRAISSYPWTRKGKYGFLMEYMQICGVEETLSHMCSDSVDSILEEVIGHIVQPQLANYVSEFTCCLMSADRKSSGRTQSEWTHRWLIPLIAAVKRRPDSQKHVSQNLLPKIMKIWPDAVVELLRWLSTSHSEQSGRDASVDIYLMLARRARTGGLLAEHLQDNEVWCGVLKRSLVDEAIHSASTERRLSAFALVCESHKTASPVTDYEYVWVNDFIRDNSFQNEPSFKQQMTSHLKHFLYHVLESSRKHNSFSQQPAKDFLKTLGNRQVDRLRLDDLASHRGVALDILTLISQIFPYGTFDNTVSSSQ